MEEQTEPFSQQFIEKVILDIFRPLGIMHSRKKPVIHRDISTCNLLIKQKNRNGTVDIVVNDFDLVREISGTATLTHNTGKIRYMAPEVDSGKYGVKVDIWSAGVVLIELMTLSSDCRLNIMTDSTEQQMHNTLRETIVSNYTNIYK